MSPRLPGQANKEVRISGGFSVLGSGRSGRRAAAPGARAGGLWGAAGPGRGCGAAGAQRRALPEPSTPRAGPAVAPGPQEAAGRPGRCPAPWSCRPCPPGGPRLDTAAGQAPALGYGLARARGAQGRGARNSWEMGIGHGRIQISFEAFRLGLCRKEWFCSKLSSCQRMSTPRH